MKKIKVRIKIGVLEIEELQCLLKNNPNSVILKNILLRTARQASKKALDASEIAEAIPPEHPY